MATRSKGAHVSIGNSPEADRPSAEEVHSPGENDHEPDKVDRLSADQERPATEGGDASHRAADHAPLTSDDSYGADDGSLSDADDDLFETDGALGIGHALNRARNRAGLTLDDVSSATRVRVPIVQAIEQDDFSRCGGDVYARGHIKTLARAVGLDPEPLLERFDAEHGDADAPTPATPLFEAERIRPERRSPNWTAAMVAAIVAVVGFVGFTLVNTHHDEGGKTQTAQGANPAESHSTPQPTKTAPASPTPDPTDSAIAAAPRDKVTVMVNAADGRSWISVKDHNGQLLFDGLLEKGEKKTFQDDEKIDLVLGNAGSLQLYVNGKKIDSDFRPGQVQRLTYTKGDPEAG